MCGTTKTKCDGGRYIHLLRQLLVCSGAWSSFFILGLNMGATTVVVPQLRNEANSTNVVTPEEASWLPVIFSYSGIPWVFILPMIAAFYGRKITHIIVCCCTLIGFVIFYYSYNVRSIMISEVFQGPVMTAYMTISIIIITEYTSSEYRGVFLTIKSATFFWGILVANTMGTFFYWKKIPLFGIICSFYNLFTVFFWPESPLWLAQKGRFDQCAASHRWLKGSGRNSEKELEKLIASNQNVENILSLKCHAIATVKVIIKKQFYKPVLLTFLLISLYMFSGKLICSIYAIDILKQITNNTSTAYTGMLVLDGVTVLAMYIGCGLAKVFKRRPLLITSATISVLFLFVLSLYLYLVNLAVISEDKYVSISLLVGFSVAIGSGPMILSTSISGELIPIESRSFSLCAIALAFKILYGIFVKVAPYIFSYFGMHGAFLLFGICSVVCIVLVYFYLPETKDRTLQEIADCMSGVVPVDEAKELLPVTSNNIRIVSKDEL